MKGLNISQSSSFEGDQQKMVDVWKMYQYVHLGNVHLSGRQYFPRDKQMVNHVHHTQKVPLLHLQVKGLIKKKAYPVPSKNYLPHSVFSSNLHQFSPCPS